MRLSCIDLITQNFVLPLWNERCFKVIDQFLSHRANVKTTFISGKGPDILKKCADDIFQAFSVFILKIEKQFQFDNQLFYQWSAEAFQEGSIFGIPKTNQRVFVNGLLSIEINNGLISSYQGYSNIPQILRQTYEIHTLNPQLHLSSELRKLTVLPLTRREVECLCFWLRGCNIKETAKHMGGLSARTIQTYRENVKKKFKIFSFQKIFSLIQQSGIMPLFLENQYGCIFQEFNGSTDLLLS